MERGNLENPASFFQEWPPLTFVADYGLAAECFSLQFMLGARIAEW